VITQERLTLALKQLGPQDGFSFEKFANAFLTADFPALRPVAGMHDGARDAFIYNDLDLPDSFIQHSVTKDWKTKIKATIKALRKEGHNVRELVYCSPQDIQREADELKRDLRRDGVSLDVRDKTYFLANANNSQGQELASELLARQFVDPLISPMALARGADSSVLNSEEERVAATYLTCAMYDRNPDKSLTRFTYESLVQYALRDATPEALMPKQKLITFIRSLTPSTEATRCAELVEQALSRLIKRGVVKHHVKSDEFTLGFEQRKEMKERLVKLLNDTSTVTKEIEGRVTTVARELGIDFSFRAEDVAHDCILLLDQMLLGQSEQAVQALATEKSFFFRREDATEMSLKLLAKPAHGFLSIPALDSDQFLDLIPAVLEDVVARPSEHLAEKLRNSANAYCLLFTLREAPDVQMVLQKVFRSARLLVDTSVLVPCLAETLLPKEEQRMSNLLRAATQSGIQILITDDVLNELETHLERIRYVFARHIAPLVDRVGRIAAADSTGAIVAAYLRHGEKAGIGSMDEFVNLFMGRENPSIDLTEYLQHEMGIKYAPLEEEFQSLNPATLAEVTELWKQTRKKKAEMEDDVFDRLIHHDVRALLVTEKLRRMSGSDATYGQQWWWLTRDRSAYRVDLRFRAEKGPSLCMSPEFFIRYLSMSPMAAKSGQTALLPISVELASLGLIPAEMRDEAVRLLETSKNWKEYQRRRKLRELINKAYSERGDGSAATDKEDMLTV
jgi:hypothetical protein